MKRIVGADIDLPRTAHGAAQAKVIKAHLVCHSAIASIIVIWLECRHPPDDTGAPTHQSRSPSAPLARASPIVILLPTVVSPDDSMRHYT
jgi:hypothetical protein